jgi:hypothetical protein
MYEVGQVIDPGLSAPWETTIKVIDVEDYGDTVIVTTEDMSTGNVFHRSANLPKTCEKCMRFPMDLRTLDGHKH